MLGPILHSPPLLSGFAVGGPGSSKLQLEVVFLRYSTLWSAVLVSLEMNYRKCAKVSRT